MFILIDTNALNLDDSMDADNFEKAPGYTGLFDKSLIKTKYSKLLGTDS